MYRVELSQTAEKQLYKLDKDTQQRIISVLERMKIRPYSHVKKLVNSPYFRLRVGNYRVIVDIKDTLLVIFVIELGKRENVYD